MKMFEDIKKPDWNDPKNYELPNDILDAIDEMDFEERELNSLWISELLAIYPRKKYPPVLVN